MWTGPGMETAAFDSPRRCRRRSTLARAESWRCRLATIADAREGLRHIDMLILRPSMDLGRLANDFEAALPRTFRFLVRGLGSRETRSNDLLSLLMFQPDYIARVI